MRFLCPQASSHLGDKLSHSLDTTPTPEPSAVRRSRLQTLSSFLGFHKWLERLEYSMPLPLMFEACRISAASKRLGAASGSRADSLARPSVP